MIIEWIDQFVGFATTWLWLVLLATWRALPILIIAAAIGLAFRRKLTPWLHALLLTIVLVRLLLPVSIGSPLSLHKPIDSWFSVNTGETAARPLSKIAPDRTLGFMPYEDRDDVRFSWVPSVPQPTATPFWWTELLWAAISFTVVSVSIGLLLRSILSHIRFALKLRSCRQLDPQPLIDLLLRECDSLAVGRRPVVREVPSLAAPAVFGVFQQTICLPPGILESLSEQELRWVVRHELAHIRRRDIPVVIMASLVSVFHWFNPIVWLLVHRLRTAMEAAADQLALQTLSQSEASAYGSFLLRLAESSVAAKKSPTLGLISFASGRHLKQRVKLLMREKKSTGMVSRILLPSLIATVALVGLTDAMESEQKMPELHLANNLTPPHVQPWWNDPSDARESDGPTFVEEYDLESIFETMPKVLTDSKTSPQEQLTAWLPLPPSLEGAWRLEGKTLSAELTARQHQLLKQTLEIWNDGEPRQISIEARFIQTNIKTASSIDWAGRRIEGLAVRGLGPAIAARIDQSELAELIQTVSADSRGNIMLAPKVTLYDGQTAGIGDQVHRPFVIGVDPKADGRLQPVISIVDEGLSFVLTPKAGDEEAVTLDFQVKSSSIGKVSYANLPFRSSNNSESQFTVQVPATEQYEVSSSVKLAAGESIVVAIPRLFNNEPGADAESTMIVALTPRIINLQNLPLVTERTSH